MENNLKELIQDLDSEMGSMLINLEDLEAINTEMGRVMDIVENTDESKTINMAMVFKDIAPTLRLINSLLHYSVKDLSKDFEESYELKTKLFQGILHGEKNE